MNYKKRKVDDTDIVEDINSKFLKLTVENNKGRYINDSKFKSELRTTMAYQPVFNPVSPAKKLSTLVCKLKKLKLDNMKDQGTQTDINFEKCVENQVIKYQGTIENFYKNLLEKNSKIGQINNVPII